MDWQNFMDGIMGDISTLADEIPETAKLYADMGKVAKKPGALDEKTKEFVALGIAISTRCDSCIGFHVKSLVRLNATRDELCEMVSMAIYMGGGPSYAYGAKALAAYDTFSQK